MAGKGRHQVLAVRSVDPVLSLAGPVGLVGSLGTGLVIDLTNSVIGPNKRTLRDLMLDGPSLEELSPGRPGIALLPGGGVDLADASELIARLSERWPAVALRVTGSSERFPTVPLVPLYPSRLIPIDEPRGVWQPVGSGATPPGPGPVLPRLRPGVLRRILSGNLPRRSRWITAWRPVWEMPWA